MTTVTVDGVRKEFGDETAVNGVSLTVEDGETVGIVGPSGCGKTTTLRTIAGLESPTEGRVLFDGEDVTSVPVKQREVGLLFQSYALFENMTVLENVTFGPRMQGVPEEEGRERAQRLLEMLDIEELESRMPHQLSGGQQQRVGLARALAPEPRILLLDEPMTGLDAKLKRQLRSKIAHLLDELDVTTLYVTHDQEEAMAMCDRVAVMNDGIVEQVGTPDTVYERPANEFVADFIGTTNLLSGCVENGHIDLEFTTIPTPEAYDQQGSVKVVARPEVFSIGGDDLQASIIDTFYLGEQIELLATLPNGQEITLKPQNNILVEPGEKVSIGIDTSRVHLLEDT
jgi:putative spermidine/putrescine transport system ATP-binding protein